MPIDIQSTGRAEGAGTSAHRAPGKATRAICAAVVGLALGAAPLRANPSGSPPAEAAPFVLPADGFDLDPVTGALALRPGLLPAPNSARPVVSPSDGSAAAGLLRRLHARGMAAGLAGVLYDNRDRGHSAMPPGAFPQTRRIVYPPAMVAADADYGLAGRFRFPAIVIGNSSTAITSGLGRRSLPRLAMTGAGNAARAAADYGANAVYVYPEHRDHDAVDLFPALWPYMIVSQGSSGSDRPFLRTAALIVAAFRPDTRARLEAEGLVAPTVQMVLRRAQVGVRTRADYLSGRAHPSAFSSRALAPAAMVSLAQSLAPDAIPPMVRLRVMAEDFGDGAGLAGLSERLFDTPGAIARLWRSPAWSRSMTVSAAETTDPNGRALRFDWRVLRGDPAHVRITPLDPQGTRARITVEWQDPRPAPAGFAAPGAPPLSARVDIGVFASNGINDSAPAFVSIDFPAHQLRRYGPGPETVPRLEAVDYDARGRDAAFDPVLWWSAPWRDVYRYDAAGALAGWTRIATQPTEASAAAAGSYDAAGRRADGRAVRYGADPARRKSVPPDLVVIPGPEG